MPALVMLWIRLSLELFFLFTSGYIYLIGGSMDERFDDVGSRVVTRLNLQKGCLERTQPLPCLALRPAVATSSSAIAVCGGISSGTPLAHCQHFSVVTEKYVDFLPNVHLCHPCLFSYGRFGHKDQQ